MAIHPLYNYHDIGVTGEDLVAQWLQSKGWAILHRRWRCKLGEIDIIAQHSGEQGKPNTHNRHWHLLKSKLAAKGIGMLGEEVRSPSKSKRNFG